MEANVAPGKSGIFSESRGEGADCQRTVEVVSIAIIGKDASYEFRWRTWALLRDVLVAHLDEKSLPAFCAIGDVLVKGELMLDARTLAADMARIREWLVGQSFDSLVIGPRTASLVYLTDMANTRRQLTRTEIDRIRPIADSRDLAEYFSIVVESLAHVSAHPNDRGMVEVIDG
jgi:hypothetical protein